MDMTTAVEIVYKNLNTLDTAAQGDPTKADSKFSKKDLKAILENPDKYSPELVGAAQFLMNNKSFFFMKKHDGKISDEDLQIWMSQNDPNFTTQASTQAATQKTSE